MQKLGVLLLAILAVSGTTVSETSVTYDQVFDILSHHREGLQNWLWSGLNGWSRPSYEKDWLTCALCDTVVGFFIGQIRDGVPIETVINETVTLCKTLDIVAADVCEMVVPIFADPLHYMITDHEWITRFDVCGIVLGGDYLPGCFYMNSSMTDWVTEIDFMKPPVEEVPLLPADTPSVKVLHITDVHPDLHYVEGSLGYCDKPMCCRPDPMDDPSNTSISAGHWGHFKCDFPMKSTSNLFNAAAADHADAEFVLMTGDLVHHQVWNTTVEDNIAHFIAYGNAIKAAFPSTKIYPAIGNHEAHPCNMFPPSAIWDDYDISWMYEANAQIYGDDLPADALESFRAAGYYTLLHKPGFRLVVLNTNFCYTNNFWIIYDAVDPEGQLQWFSDVMHAAEEAGELVWVVGHVPPGGGDCWSHWSLQYTRIVNRYESIIMAQFYGHTHNDEFRLFFDKSEVGEPPRPTNALYIGASVTPYTDLNPGYKVYYADGVRENATWEIMDHETYVYNLTQANDDGESVEPTYYKEYSAKEAFGLQSFRPADLWDFVQRMAVDDDLYRTYFRYWYKDSGMDEEDEDCPSTGNVSECKFDLLCGIVDTDYTTEQCDRLKALARKAKHGA